jgi:hypothetical protein
VLLFVVAIALGAFGGDGGGAVERSGGITSSSSRTSIGPRLAAAAAPADAGADQQQQTIVVRTGEQLGAALAQLSARGPPLTVAVGANISMSDVPSPRPAVIARDTTFVGLGGPAERTELSLDDVSNGWRLERGVTLRMRNLTLSNLATRPPSALPPPPANVSVFTFPLWFFDADRCAFACVCVCVCRKAHAAAGRALDVADTCSLVHKTLTHGNTTTHTQHTQQRRRRAAAAEQRAHRHPLR